MRVGEVKAGEREVGRRLRVGEVKGDAARFFGLLRCPSVRFSFFLERNVEGVVLWELLPGAVVTVREELVAEDELVEGGVAVCELVVEVDWRAVAF